LTLLLRYSLPIQYGRDSFCRLVYLAVISQLQLFRMQPFKYSSNSFRFVGEQKPSARG